MLHRHLAILPAACIALALAPASSHAADLTLSPRTQLARPGQTVQLRAKAPITGRCQLRVDARGRRVTTPRTGAFVISARVSARARPGAHSLSLRCSARSTRVRVAVARSAGNRKARGDLFRGSVRFDAVREVPVPSAPAPSPAAAQGTPLARPILPASAEAQRWWASNVVAINASFRNGQCTDWAQQRRPDIVQSAYMKRYDRFGPDGVVTSWDAKYWVQHAMLAGLGVARAPAVGAIMVFAPGSYGAGSSGHVAFVEAVAGDGSFEITEMSPPDVGKVVRGKFGPWTAQAMATDPGITFIL